MYSIINQPVMQLKQDKMNRHYVGHPFYHARIAWLDWYYDTIGEREEELEDEAYNWIWRMYSEIDSFYTHHDCPAGYVYEWMELGVVFCPECGANLTKAEVE